MTETLAAVVSVLGILVSLGLTYATGWWRGRLIGAREASEVVTHATRHLNISKMQTALGIRAVQACHAYRSLLDMDAPEEHARAFLDRELEIVGQRALKLGELEDECALRSDFLND